MSLATFAPLAGSALQGLLGGGQSSKSTSQSSVSATIPTSIINVLGGGGTVSPVQSGGSSASPTQTASDSRPYGASSALGYGNTPSYVGSGIGNAPPIDDTAVSDDNTWLYVAGGLVALVVVYYAFGK